MFFLIGEKRAQFERPHFELGKLKNAQRGGGVGGEGRMEGKGRRE